jgi:hypothetical protein
MVFSVVGSFDTYASHAMTARSMAEAWVTHGTDRHSLS